MSLSAADLRRSVQNRLHKAAAADDHLREVSRPGRAKRGSRWERPDAVDMATKAKISMPKGKAGAPRPVLSSSDRGHEAAMFAPRHAAMGGQKRSRGAGLGPSASGAIAKAARMARVRAASGRAAVDERFVDSSDDEATAIAQGGRAESTASAHGDDFAAVYAVPVGSGGRDDETHQASGSAEDASHMTLYKRGPALAWWQGKWRRGTVTSITHQGFPNAEFSVAFGDGTHATRLHPEQVRAVEDMPAKSAPGARQESAPAPAHSTVTMARQGKEGVALPDQVNHTSLLSAHMQRPSSESAMQAHGTKPGGAAGGWRARLKAQQSEKG